MKSQDSQLPFIFFLFILAIPFGHGSSESSDINLVPPSQFTIPEGSELEEINQYAYLKLCLLWPMGYCQAIEAKCRKIPNHWIIEKLSPENTQIVRSTPYYTLTKEILARYKQNLLYYWPELTTSASQFNWTFYVQQYTIHGWGCTQKFSAQEYIQLTLALVYRQRNLLDILSQHGIYPSLTNTYNPTTIIDAWRVHTQHDLLLHCSNVKEKSYLSGVSLCFTGDGTSFTDCKQKSIWNCQQDVYFPKHLPFTFQVRWPVGYCKNDTVNCHFTPRRFIIGFVATNEATTSLESNTLTKEIVSKYKSRLLKYWPDLTKEKGVFDEEFYMDEFKSYGQLFEGEEYIDFAIQLAETHLGKLMTSLRRHVLRFDKDNYNPDTIVKALRQYTGHKLLLECVIKEETYYFSGVRLCFKGNIMIDCPCTVKAMHYCNGAQKIIFPYD